MTDCATPPHTIVTLADPGVGRISTGSPLFRRPGGSSEAAVAVRDGLTVRRDLPSYSEISAWS
ncbi:hypothetical protein [Salinispora cortesiana]|uniref:hypothetical protein n=1 Tax=Salinispora cortesiana TaxID=1305843 RepID=UPI0004086D51|nr:hypothetical protein [Salinispora cortesiana]